MLINKPQRKEDGEYLDFLTDLDNCDYNDSSFHTYNVVNARVRERIIVSFSDKQTTFKKSWSIKK